MFRVLLVLMFAGVSSIAAQAETFNVKAKPGASTVIGGSFVYSRDECQAQAVSPTRVTQSPGRGRLEIRNVVARLAEGPCAGAAVRGLHFVYTPAKGYRGPEEAVVEIEWNPYVDAASRSVRTNTYRITVE